jgi:hypothetical protein
MAVTPRRRCAGGGGLVTPLPPQTLPLATMSPFTPRVHAGSVDTPTWSKAWTQAAQLQQAASAQVDGATHSSRSSLPAPLLPLPDAKPGIVSIASATSAPTCIVSMRGAPTTSACMPTAGTPSASMPPGPTTRACMPGGPATSAYATGAPTPSPAASVVSAQRAAPKLAPAAVAVARAALSMPVVPGRSTDPPPDEPADPLHARGTGQRTEQPPATTRAPVRVHVNRQEEGCVVWLGVDAGAEHLARQIVEQLAPSRPGAVPVLAVVCNGTPVYTRPRIPKENP